MGHGMGYAGDDPEYRWLRLVNFYCSPSAENRNAHP
ncbi:hypothetical protein SAMN05192553_105206 [Cyclobacterium xiamenense]|uniref:Uncharacterized protein n=1 Tax=Cyclobacterium xiamenense TaxID=1297121 RepID=A0A1H7A214_9BACT|nr:hypothetical protein SAMN05192553_105206 [Cyclobacterium xiamenense]